MANSVTITFDGPDVPAGWEGSPNKLLNFLRENWGGSVTVGQQGVITGQIGGTMPTTNIGLYISGKNFYVWDDDKAKYVIATDVPIGALLDWAGSATPPENYLLCDGRTLQIADYPDLYAAIGQGWKLATDTDLTTAFRLPDTRGRVSVGAGIGDYSINLNSLVGKMKERTAGTYFGAEWITPGTNKAPNRPTGQYNSVNNPTASTSTQTGVMQPSLVCNKIIRFK